MQLSDKAVQEFKDIYEKKVKEKISFEEARIKATDFMEFFYLITKPIKKKQTEFDEKI